MKKIGKKILSFYAECSQEVSEKRKIRKQKREAKAEQERLLQERRESAFCPHCNTQHTSSYYYSHSTKKEDIEIREEHVHRHINFLKCSECKCLFGVEGRYCFVHSLDLSRTTFKLEDRENV
jgi:hypothetical protein